MFQVVLIKLSHLTPLTSDEHEEIRETMRFCLSFDPSTRLWLGEPQPEFLWPGASMSSTLFTWNGLYMTWMTCDFRSHKVRFSGSKRLAAEAREGAMVSSISFKLNQGYSGCALQTKDFWQVPSRKRGTFDLFDGFLTRNCVSHFCHRCIIQIYDWSGLDDEAKMLSIRIWSKHRAVPARFSNFSACSSKNGVSSARDWVCCFQIFASHTDCWLATGRASVPRWLP